MVDEVDEVDEKPRNWIGEATAIAAGTSSLLPEKEHLQALAGQMESVLSNVQQLSAVILAVMVDNGVQRLPIPGGLFEHLKTKHYGLLVHPPLRDGSVVVELKAPPAPPSSLSPKARVN